MNRELNKLKESISLETVDMEYDPFSIYIEYNEAETPYEQLVDSIEHMLRSLIDNNSEVCDMLFDHLYSHIDTDTEDKSDFFKFLLSRVDLLYSISIISYKDYDNRTALIVL